MGRGGEVCSTCGRISDTILISPPLLRFPCPRLQTLHPKAGLQNPDYFLNPVRLHPQSIGREFDSSRENPLLC